MRTDNLNMDGYKAFSGKAKYLFDFEDGDCWLNVDFYADKAVEVWLIFEELELPYYEGSSGHLSLRVKHAKAAELRATPATKIVARIQHRSTRNQNEVDWTPVELVPPDVISLQLAHLIDERARAQLAMFGINTTEIEVGEDDDLDDDGDDSDLEFGSGFEEMEDDEEPTSKPPLQGNGEAPRAVMASPGTRQSDADPGVRDDPVASGDIPLKT